MALRLTIFCLLICKLYADLNIPELLKSETNMESAGVKSRISKNGVKHIASFLSNALLAELVTVDIGAEPVTVHTQNGDLTIGKMKMRIQSSINDIDIELKSPNIVVLQIKMLDILAETPFSGISTGRAMLHTPKTSAQLDIAVTRTMQGAPKLQVRSCKLSHNDHFAVNGSDPNSQRTFEKEGFDLLRSLLCTRVEYIVEARINERFGLLSTKVPLANINDETIVNELLTKMRLLRRQRDTRTRRESFISSFNVSRAENLFLDYSILSDPFMTQGGLEIETSGEVSLRGRGGTPFGAMPIAWPSNAHTESMLHMAVSDFVPNSLMYHGHTIGLFNTRIDPTTPNFGPIMKTTCNLSSGTLFCLGDLFPTLRKLHPNKQLALFFSTVQAPVIQFKPTSAGGIKFSLLGKIVISMIDEHNEKQIAEMSINVDAQMKIRLSSNAVRPKLVLKNISLKTLSPGILLQKELDDSLLLAREVLQRIVNDVLKEGIPIPVHPLFQLSKPKVKIMNRAILLQTNFILNEKLLRQLTAVDLQKRAI